MNTHQIVVEAIESQGIAPLSSITLEANLTKDLGYDSLDVVELQMILEQKFNTIIPDTETHILTTVQDIIKYLTPQLTPA